MFSNDDIIAIIGGVGAVVIFIFLLKSLSWVVNKILHLLARNHKKKPNKLYVTKIKDDVEDAIEGDTLRECLTASVSAIANAIDDVFTRQEFAIIRLSSSLTNPCYIELMRVHSDISGDENAEDGFDIEYSYGHQIGKMTMGNKRYVSKKAITPNEAKEMLLSFFRGEQGYKKMTKFSYDMGSAGGDGSGDLNNWKIKHFYIALGILGAILVLVEVLIRFQ